MTHSLVDGRVVNGGLSPRGAATGYRHGGNRCRASIGSPQVQGRQIDTRQVKFREGGINRALPVQKTNVLLFTPLLLILALVIACGSSAPEPENTQQPVVPDTPGATTPGDTGASVATAVPASTPEESGLTVPQVDRLRIAFTVPPRETNLPWSGPRSLLTQLSPMVETLLGIDPDTGAYVPMLATRWEMAPDGKSWTLDLREDVLSILTLVNSMPRTWPTRGTSWGPLKVTSTHSAIPGPPK